MGAFHGVAGLHGGGFRAQDVADAWSDHWVYWLGPLIGGGLAALVYYLTFMWGREEE